MAFFFTDGELSINGVPIGKVENVEFVKHDNSVKIPEGVIEYKPFPSQFAFEATIQFINFHKPLPEWVDRVIRIPERRIQQILGR